MDERARQHFEKALFHLGVAFKIELVLQPDAQGEEPKRPAVAVDPAKGGKEDQRKLHLVKRPRPHKARQAVEQ